MRTVDYRFSAYSQNTFFSTLAGFGCRISLHEAKYCLIRSPEISIDFAEISQPMNLHLFLMAAMAEDALPRNGSHTVKSFSALAKIIAWNTSTGF